MATTPDTLDNIRVLVCLADEDQGTALAHGLREQGLDVLVAHHIRSAMRVMEKESPQAVVVEIATTKYDGIRVAQWASGRVLEIFLVAGRPLTLMEDVEVLKSGAKETFYKPLQAATIAASIRGACDADTKRSLDPEAADPKTRYNSPPSVIRTHEAHAKAETEAEKFGTSKTESLSAVTPEDLAQAMNSLLGPAATSEDESSAHASTIVQGAYARLPDEPAPEPAPAPEPLIGVENTAEVQIDPSFIDSFHGAEADTGSTGEGEDTSSALVADLFGDSLGPTVIDPSSVSGGGEERHREVRSHGDLHADRVTPEPSSVSAPPSPTASTPASNPAESIDEQQDDQSSALVSALFDEAQSDAPPSAGATDGATSRPVERAIEAPPDDDLLMSGMMDELEELSPDSIYGSSRASRAVTEELDDEAATTDAPTTPATDDEDGQSSPTEVPDAPLTSEIIAAAYGTSKTPQLIARMLTVAVVAACGWVGFLATERMMPPTAEEKPEEPVLTEEQAAEAKALAQLHGILGEAAVAHRDQSFAEAKAGYEKALAMDDKCDIAVRGLAAIALTKEDWSATRATLNRLARIVPDDPSLALQQGLVLRELGKKSRSQAELLRFIDSTKPEDPRVRPAAQVFNSLSPGE